MLDLFLRFCELTSAGLLMPFRSHFASTAGLSFSVTFSTATSLFSLALMMSSFAWKKRREIPAYLLACNEEARWYVCAVRNRVKHWILYPHAASVSGEMPNAQRDSTSSDQQRQRWASSSSVKKYRRGKPEREGMNGRREC